MDQFHIPIGQDLDNDMYDNQQVEQANPLNFEFDFTSSKNDPKDQSSILGCITDEKMKEINARIFNIDSQDRNSQQ